MERISYKLFNNQTAPGEPRYIPSSYTNYILSYVISFNNNPTQKRPPDEGGELARLPKRPDGGSSPDALIPSRPNENYPIAA